MVVGIVGLGLIGGSLGLALKNVKLVSKIVGYDHNEKHKKEALELLLVDEIVDFETIKKSDIIFLAIPVEAVIKTLETLKDISQETTIVDLGSTKKLIVDSIPQSIRSNFIAAHPMAGTEKFGPSAAINGLYEGKVVVLCNLAQSGDLHKNRAIVLFSHIGMKIHMMSADEHDRHAAFISHMPHIASYALANAVMGQEDPKSILILAAGGFKDMSRIAKSSPAMWGDIFKQNKNNLLESIGFFQKEIDLAKKLIEEERWDELKGWMQKATTLHEIL